MHRYLRDHRHIYVGWLLILLGHISVYIGGITAIIMSVIHEPWYLSCFLVMCFFSPALAGFFCLLTHAENYFRGKMNWPIIPDDCLSFYMRKWKMKGTVINMMFRED